MKIFLLGGGPKIAEIAEAFSGRKLDLTVISADVRALRDVMHKRASRLCTDPASFDYGSLENPPELDDLLVVCESEERHIRAVIDHLQSSKVPGTIIAFTPTREKKLGRDYPDILFKSDRDVFRKELRELVRFNHTIRRVGYLRSVVRCHPKLLILMWGNPDPDSMGAAVALKELLKNDVKEITIAYTGEFTRTENRAMAKILKIPTSKFRPEMLTEETTVATVDAQPSFFDFEPPIHFDVVIDHHPVAELGAPAFVDIRPEYGSTAAMMTEYYRHTKTEIPKRIATALFLGLKVDTNNLTRNVSDADVETFAHLRTLADENWMRMVELSTLPMSILDDFGKAIATRKVAKDVTFAYLGEVDNPDNCVHVADFLIKLSEISWTIVAARYNGKIVIVFRTDGYRKHAGKVAESLFHPYGTAGGHRTMARAELRVEKVEEETGPMSNGQVENWLLGKLGERLRPLARLKQE